MKILIIDDVHSVLGEALNSAGFDCIYYERDADDAGIADALRSCEGLVLRSRIKVDRRFLDGQPQLKFIARVGAGLEHIDVEYARAKGVEVLSSPEGNREAVAEQALGNLLALMNRTLVSDAQVRSGVWNRKANSGDELAGKTVAIIGFGNTGGAFARLLRGFDLEVIAFDKFKESLGDDHVEAVTMHEVFNRADVVSLHIPYDEDTHMIVNEEWLSSFKKPFYLINTSRGQIVDTTSLLQGLDSGKVKGAVLDVLEYENEQLEFPALEELPAEARALFNRENVVLTPHTAGLSGHSYYKLAKVLADKIIERFKSA